MLLGLLDFHSGRLRQAITEMKRVLVLEHPSDVNTLNADAPSSARRRRSSPSSVPRVDREPGQLATAAPSPEEHVGQGTGPRSVVHGREQALVFWIVGS